MTVGILEAFRTGMAQSTPISVEQYHQMIATGILNEDDPLELIDGMLVRRDRLDSKGGDVPQGDRHSGVIGQLCEQLTLSCAPLGCHVRSQLPLPLPPIDEPEPDVCIVRGRARDFIGRFPECHHVLAIWEVSDNSLGYDQNSKLRLYAASKRPIYVIVNLKDDQIEVYSHPNSVDQSYSESTVYRRGDTFELKLTDLGTLDLAVDELM